MQMYNKVGKLAHDLMQCALQHNGQEGVAALVATLVEAYRIDLNKVQSFVTVSSLALTNACAKADAMIRPFKFVWEDRDRAVLRCTVCDSDLKFTSLGSASHVLRHIQTQCHVGAMLREPKPLKSMTITGALKTARLTPGSIEQRVKNEADFLVAMFVAKHLTVSINAGADLSMLLSKIITTVGIEAFEAYVKDMETRANAKPTETRQRSEFFTRMKTLASRGSMDAQTLRRRMYKVAEHLGAMQRAELNGTETLFGMLYNIQFGIQIDEVELKGRAIKLMLGMCTWIDDSLDWRVAPLVHYRTTAQGEGAQGLEWVQIARHLADAGLLDRSESTVAPEDRAADINSGFLHMAADGALAADRHSAGPAGSVTISGWAARGGCEPGRDQVRFQTWCAAHRMNLCLGDAVVNEGQLYVDLLQKLPAYIEGSSTRKADFERLRKEVMDAIDAADGDWVSDMMVTDMVGSLLEATTLELQRCSRVETVGKYGSTRWSSMCKVTRGLYVLLTVLTVHFENLSKTGEDKAAVEINEALTGQQGMLCFMTDFCGVYDECIRFLQITRRPILGEVFEALERPFLAAFDAVCRVKNENDYYRWPNHPAFTVDQKQPGSRAFYELIMNIGEPQAHLRGQDWLKGTNVDAHELPAVERLPSEELTPDCFAAFGEGKFFTLLEDAGVEAQRRWMNEAANFLFVFVVGFVKRFRYDWEYLRACQVLDPSTVTRGVERGEWLRMVNTIMTPYQLCLAWQSRRKC